MRSGIWREATHALALAGVLISALSASARADLWPFHTIPRETLAADLRTGEVMMAPPIPYGAYTKDYAGTVHGAVGHAAGTMHGALGHVKGAGQGLHSGLGQGHHGAGCTDCATGHGGQGHGGLLGHGGQGHHAAAHGDPTGGHGLLGHGSGLKGGGLFGHGSGGHGTGGLGGHGLFGHGTGGALCGEPGQPCPTPQAHVLPSGQVAQSTHGCGQCGGLGLLGASACGTCGGNGLLGGLGGSCHGCGGKGLLGGSPCGGCGGHGLLGGGHGGGGLGLHGGGLGDTCHSCKGKGCKDCGLGDKAHQLAGLPHHLMGKAHAAVGTVLHRGDIKYFVGPGGPVPLTPGYVPYVVPTRSPREFFAFPPYSDRAMP